MSLGSGSRALPGLGTMSHLQLGLGFSVAEGAQTKVGEMVELMLLYFLKANSLSYRFFHLAQLAHAFSP